MPQVDWNMVASVAWGVFAGGLLAASLAVPIYTTLATTQEGGHDQVFIAVIAAVMSFLGTSVFLGACYVLWEYAIPWTLGLVAGVATSG